MNIYHVEVLESNGYQKYYITKLCAASSQWDAYCETVGVNKCCDCVVVDDREHGKCLLDRETASVIATIVRIDHNGVKIYDKNDVDYKAK